MVNQKRPKVKSMKKKNMVGGKKKNTSRKCRTYKGGIILKYDVINIIFKPDEKIDETDLELIRSRAIQYFLDNSEITVLTNNSRNCITLVATLKKSINSPFNTLRIDKIVDEESDPVDNDITKILIKVLITKNENENKDAERIINIKQRLANLQTGIQKLQSNQQTRVTLKKKGIDINQRELYSFIEKEWVLIPQRSREINIFHDITFSPPLHGIAITHLKDFREEVKTQIDIYRKSFIAETSLFDPICPAIIYINENDNYLKKYIQKYIDANAKDNPDVLTLEKMLERTRTNKDPTLSISTIYMEYMDGFDVAYNVIKPDSERQFSETGRFSPKFQEYYFKCIQFEFIQLHKLGYSHGDAHLNNIMINPNYPYFCNGDKIMDCKIIIIDFDRTKKLPSKLINSNNNQDTTYINHILMHNKFMNTQFFDKMYTITPLQYKQFLKERLTFINIIIKPFIQENTTSGDNFIQTIVNNTFTYGGKTVIHPDRSLSIPHLENNFMELPLKKNNELNNELYQYPEYFIRKTLISKNKKIYSDKEKFTKILRNMYNDPYLQNIYKDPKKAISF